MDCPERVVLTASLAAPVNKAFLDCLASVVLTEKLADLGPVGCPVTVEHQGQLEVLDQRVDLALVANLDREVRLDRLVRLDRVERVDGLVSTPRIAIP